MAPTRRSERVNASQLEKSLNASVRSVRFRVAGPRVQCDFCEKDYAKSYIKTHLKKHYGKLLDASILAAETRGADAVTQEEKARAFERLNILGCPNCGVVLDAEVHLQKSYLRFVKQDVSTQTESEVTE